MNKLVLNAGAWLALTAALVSCNDDSDKPKAIPEVTTIAASNIMANSATAGGEIIDDGNAAITASGIVYSMEPNPTIEDDSTKTDVTEGEFSSLLDELESTQKYYYRAYAINSVGVAYGEELDFTTGNAAPTATNVTITGEVKVNRTLTADYDYVDADGDTEGETIIQWYKATDVSGSGAEPIEGANELTYLLQPADEFAFVTVGITPVATAGTLSGVEVKADYTTAVAVPSDITFTYNNESVTYGIITSSVTGRKWMDRNLGAPGVPSAHNDYVNQGDLFQWGRRPDGHQLVTRTDDGSGVKTTTPVNSPISNARADSDSPDVNVFIGCVTPTFDWRDPQNSNLWQAPDKINNPCPEGWHIPTKEEWETEQLVADMNLNYTQLNLTYTGYRTAGTGSMRFPETSADYWTSTPDVSTSYKLIIFGGDPTITLNNRGLGSACRCIKDN